ncbi:unnamed protein product (mitochondrion) [Plasmodiophora brassicae]|uniref:Choline transporter-like protein n=1 Tax=Plasmodiophora brassicae TaxID=37360 RepID=A0A0G4J4B0_PLABS|nr:hypothetical protein PBRA_008999 [Plasmodiophora brassicae]SPQ99924.1 unnamed protein product [Plasmodiophora brassicae]
MSTAESGARGADHVLQRTPWRDVAFAILFLSHLIGFIAFDIYWRSSGEDLGDDDDGDRHSRLNISAEQYMAFVGFGVVVAMFLGVIWITLLKRFAHAAIKLGVCVTVGVFLCKSILLFSLGQIIGGSVALFVAGALALYFFLVRNRLRFVSILVEMSCTAISPGLVAASVLATILGAVWSVYVTGLAAMVSHGVMAILGLFSLFWTWLVFKNVVHVATAGKCATWYFLGDDNAPPNATWAAFHRALTTSFGSVCLGSFLVALMRTLETVSRSAARSSDDACVSLVCGLLACLVECVRHALEFVSKYAFVYCGVYGESFFASARSTWQLLMAKGFDVIIDDDLSHLASVPGALAGGLLAGLAMLAVITGVHGATPIYGDLDNWIIALLFSLWFILAVSVVLAPVSSGVATFIVLLAEDPYALSKTRPEFHAKVSDGLHEVYGEFAFA